MRIAIVQSAADPENGKIDRRRVEALVAEHSQPGDLWILPEAFDTGWSISPENIGGINGRECELLLDSLSRRFGIAICGSYYEALDGGAYSNTFRVVSYAEGFNLVGAKRHLFGDFEKHQVRPGHAVLTFSMGGIRIRAVVCYDLRFPVWCRHTAQEPYDALVCVSQWPMQRAADRRLLMQARAMENVAYTVNANALGDSMVCLPDGRPDFAMEVGRELGFYNLDISVVENMRKRKRYLADADDFCINM